MDLVLPRAGARCGIEGKPEQTSKISVVAVKLQEFSENRLAGILGHTGGNTGGSGIDAVSDIVQRTADRNYGNRSDGAGSKSVPARITSAELSRLLAGADNGRVVISGWAADIDLGLRQVGIDASGAVQRKSHESAGPGCRDFVMADATVGRLDYGRA